MGGIKETFVMLTLDYCGIQIYKLAGPDIQSKLTGSDTVAGMGAGDHNTDPLIND